MRKLRYILLPIFLLLIIFQLSISDAHANSEMNKVVSVVQNAYGSKKLSNLRQIQIDDEYRETFRGQGYTTEYDDFWVIKSRSVLDFKKQLGSYETWADQYGRIMQFHNLSNDTGIANIDYQEGYYQAIPNINFYQGFGRVIRASDTLLAYELIKPERKKGLLGSINYLGKQHYHVELEVPASPPLNLYIEQSTGFIKRMSRVFTNGDRVVYVFENHSSKNGITYAKEYRLFINGGLIFLTRKRSISVNKIDSNVFKMAKGLVKEPQRFAVEKMTTTKVSKNLHHVGQNSFTSFYDAGEYIIGFGGYAGLRQRFEAYQKAVGNKKPLLYQIPTHHHTDHTAGLADALALGAKIVSSVKLKPRLFRDINGLKEDNIVTFDKNHTLDGLKIFEISTSHVQNMAVIYIPEAKAIFQEDHYAGFFVSKPNAISRNTYTFYQSVLPLKLDIKKILSTHSGKIEDWSLISENMAKYSETNCAFSRSICSN